ncbi:MAG TPA: tryptophan--tRNA ligase, partial [Pseudonocardiaceae bacterium]|nr:tryptophan--tRNA ligase [Pseudonocardiaceae bacterium]
DSTPVEAPKDPDSSLVFQLLTSFATAEVIAGTRRELEAGGLGWGALKDRLATVLNEQLAPMRERYDALMAPDSELDGVLAAGAEKARKRTTSVLHQVRQAIGI